MKTKAIALFTALSFVSGQVVAAAECFSPVTPPTLTPGKQAEIIIAQDDHPQFKDPARKCSFYLSNYYAEGFKAAGLAVPTQAECLADSTLVDLSKGFAPFGAFFRSNLAVTDSEVASYLWEITGPDGVLAKYDSFNAAHIFETAGTYTANLTVTLKNGTTLTDQKTVTVWPRNGNTYYVNSALGDDRYDGRGETPDLSCDKTNQPIGACNGPWQTATRAFGALTPHNWVSTADGKYSAAAICETSSTRTASNGTSMTPVTSCDKLRSNTTPIIKAGDQILFMRGQTFEFETGMITTNATTSEPECVSVVSTGHWPASLGVLFAAYGNSANARPKIINTAAASCNAFNIGGVGMFHLAFQDLQFDLQSAKKNPFDVQGNRAIFMYAAGNMMNLVLLRVDLKKFNQGIIAHNVHGEFLKDNLFYDSFVTHMYSETASDVAVINNKFDYSANHIMYTNMSNGLIVGNKYSRQAFGRTQLRIYGSVPSKFITESVWVSDNQFTGWIDPRTSINCPSAGCTQYANGKRYNFTLVEINPNTPEMKFNNRIVFKRNTLKNAETNLRFSNSAHLLIEDNIFDSVDNSNSPRLRMHWNYPYRPLNDVTVRNNLFVERSIIRAPNSKAINLDTYSENNCTDLLAHKDINVTGNKVMAKKAICAVGKSTTSGTESACLLDASQMAGEGTLGAVDGLTMTSNQVSSSATLAQLNQAVVDKKSLLSAAMPVIAPPDPPPAVIPRPSLKNIKRSGKK